MTADELIAYFESKELPATVKVRASNITDVAAFVKTNILRLKEGVPAIKRASMWLLEELHDHLEKK